MSRIYKWHNINVDEDNKVYIKHEDLPFYHENVDELDYDEDNFPDFDEDSLEAINERADNILFNAHSKATEIEKSAHLMAEGILSDANARQEQIFKNAKNDGYEEGQKLGFEEGYEQANIELQGLILEKQNEIDDLKKVRDELLYNAEKDAIDMIVDIVGKITYDAIKINPQIFSVLIRKGVENSNIQSKVSIKVSADDYDNVMDNFDEILKFVESSKEIEVLKDFSLQENDCLIETEFGNVNCGLDEQLKSVKECLYFIMNENKE